MANRWFNQFFHTLEKFPVALYAKVSFGTSGAPTLSVVNSKGIASISRSAAGTYLVTLQDKYVKLLCANGVFDASAAAAGVPDAPEISISNNGVTSGTLTIKTLAGGVDTDPAENEVLYLKIELSNSGAL